MTDQAAATVDSPADAGWAVEHFARFWANPDPTGDAMRLAPDIVGRWPDGRVLRGIPEYRGRLIKIGMLIPDIRLEVLESAVNGDLRSSGGGRMAPDPTVRSSCLD